MSQFHFCTSVERMMGQVIQVARKQLRRILPVYSPVWWANFGRASRFVAHSIPPIFPPILIISLPRSGSSWLGDLFGISSNALYLREPITQSYLVYKKSGPSFFEANLPNLPATYESYGDSAFAGLPAFPRSIVRYPQQWSLSERRHRHLVIKEVNPLALDWLIKKYNPKIVYLVRHPAAVANSFYVQNWTGKQFESRFSRQTLDSENFGFEQFTYSFWAEHGALQAVILKRSLSLLERYKDHRIVKYEDLCTNPRDIFFHLFEFCGLNWDAGIETEIRGRSTSLEPYKAGGYDLERNSAAMTTKWKTEISKEHLDQLQEAYLSYNPPYYSSETW